MTATFWTGSSLSFTNGSKTVTVNTGPSLDSVKANSSLTAGNYNEPVEVKSVSGNTITLYNNWPGSTGTTSATIKPSAAAAASAGVAAQQLITDIQSLVSSASATATANSFVKRDSNGRIKAASPSANDDVVTKGYFSSNIPSAPELFGVGSLDCPSIGNLETEEVKAGLYKFRADVVGSPPATFGSTLWFSCEVIQSHQDRVTFDAKLVTGSKPRHFIGERVGKTGAITWVENYNTGNLNLTELGTWVDDWVVQGYIVNNSGYTRFYRPLFGASVPTSLTVVGSFKIINGLTGATLLTGITSISPSTDGSASALVFTLQLPAGTYEKNTPIFLVSESTTTRLKINY